MNNVLRSFALVVGIPTLIAALYFAFIASDMYVSETRFAIRASKSDAGGGLASLLSSSVISAGGQDSRVVVDYIQSQDILATLERKLGLVAHYSNPDVDWVSRLESEPTREDLLTYFRQQIEIIDDGSSEIIVFKVKAYTPEFAQQISEQVIALSEQLVNELSGRIERDALESAKAEVALAAQKVRVASGKITQFRSVNTSINPAQETSALLGLLSALESKLSEVRTELSEKRAFMKENSAVVKSLKNKAAAVEKQLEEERSRVAGGGDDGMSGLINDYQPLALEQELAQQQYTSALTSLELARIEAQRKKRYLVTYVKPVLPQASTEPRRFMRTLTVLVYSFLFFAIGGLMWSALKDHIGH